MSRDDPDREVADLGWCNRNVMCSQTLMTVIANSMCLICDAGGVLELGGGIPVYKWVANASGGSLDGCCAVLLLLRGRFDML
jgi:hypothetical protein